LSQQTCFEEKIMQTISQVLKKQRNIRSKMLVEANGGIIWMGSEMGQGSTFTVRLPIKGVNHE
jgi:light-regulated signal transduction histidine kinase (bacteriophytochrome)